MLGKMLGKLATCLNTFSDKEGHSPSKMYHGTESQRTRDPCLIYDLHPKKSTKPFRHMFHPSNIYPSKIEWDLTNGPLSKLLELLDTQVFSGSVRSWVRSLEISWTF